MIDANKILLINCSYPNYNLAIEKMKVYFQGRCVEARTVDELFTQDCDGVALSVIFSWDVPFAIAQAKKALSDGKKVIMGGGGTQQLHNYIERETGIKPHYRVHDDLEAVVSNFKMVYFTRGCFKKCWFCTVPRIEGNVYSLNYNSNPALVMMDNNLAHAPQYMQKYIVEKYLSSMIKSVDINSGFEPTGMDERTVRLFDKLPLRWWRMGFDEIGEEKEFIEAVKLIQSISKRRIRAYTMFGHEPVEQCRYRCEKVIELGCEPVPQARIELNAKSKTPTIEHDWTENTLREFQRFFYRPALWRKMSYDDYAPKDYYKAERRNQVDLFTS